ncbi:peptidyl-tRNA hydrolase [Aldersonia sp. NBC_00410]|uniref:aminoacyl-tRNA hydrolase n=1 Tax=Aldersonia sp. NBC_00410 TaxID=2975954 RepID=UPI00225826E7|nr:aminoacyl-tRNA hydrolase [Aldersonia sp. NBC_00410]MCX5046073.1 peptidyl-tRNA hydrolase [Aldersonia sp. NBC_00410]
MSEQDFVSEPAGFAVRHAALARGYGLAEDPADPAAVLAMQLVLHLPKQEPPRRSAILEAAAAATVALCLDERVGPDGPWFDAFEAWTAARIRKIARRARGAHWQAAGEVPGVTAEVDGAQVRALVPGPVGEVDSRIKRLQIGGTDLEHDDPGQPERGLPVLWINPTLEMTLGKAAAQVGHAAMLLVGALTVAQAWDWAQSGFRSAVRGASANQWIALQQLVGRGHAVAVRDAGFTEVAPGSMTVIAVPDLGLA